MFASVESMRTRMYRVSKSLLGGIRNKKENEMNVKPGDIVQVTDETHPWFPALLIVSEVKVWGVQAGCLVPRSNVENDVATAWNRLKTGSFERVGAAVILDASIKVDEAEP